MSKIEIGMPVKVKMDPKTLMFGGLTGIVVSFMTNPVNNNAPKSFKVDFANISGFDYAYFYEDELDEISFEELKK